MELNFDPADSSRLLWFYTTQEVAQKLGLASGTIENWRYQGKGPRFVKIGRVVRYPEDWLAEWVEEVRNAKS